MEKPTRVLCKKTMSLGNEEFTYVSKHFVVTQKDNRMIVVGDWYPVIENPNDGENTFSILDHQQKVHLFYMYESDDLDLPRTYKKWFYTVDELREMKLIELGINENF